MSRVTLSLPQLAAAVVLVALISGAVIYAVLSRPAVPRLPLADIRPASTDSNLSDPHEAAISELRRALAQGRGTLDPKTVGALESNLAIIELAIGQARRALEADPGNSYVRAHLAETMRRKTELLKRATVLASAGD